MATGSWSAPRWVRWAGGVVLFVLAVVLPLARQQGVHPWRVVWAEDGAVYYPDAIHSGVDALFRGSQGYLQFASRLLMAPAVLVPLGSVSIYIALAAALFSAALAAFVYRSTGGWIASTPMRLLVAAFYVVGPAAAWEQTGNATNAIWVVLAAAPWALVSTRRTKTDVAIRGLVVLVAALSHPLAALFLPLAAVAVWRRRSFDAWVVGAVLTCGVVAQVLFMTVAPARHPREPGPLTAIFPTVSVDVLGSFLTGERYLSSLWLRFGFPLAVAFAVVTAAIVVLCAWGASSRSRMLGVVLVVYAALMACGPLVSNGPVVLHEGLPLQPIERYAFVPVALLVGALAVFLDAPDRSRRRVVARVGRPVLLVQSVVVILLSFAVWNPRSHGPLWNDSVRAAEEACANGSGIAQLDLTPPGAGWVVILRCDDITR
jgi:hypothetical protein